MSVIENASSEQMKLGQRPIKFEKLKYNYEQYFDVGLILNHLHK